MSEKSSAEQTEEPTARKLRNARDEGQVARSAELPAAAVTIGAILAMFMMGGYWMTQMTEIFVSDCNGDRKEIHNRDLRLRPLGKHVGQNFVQIGPK